jgi:hypothetical protein
MCNLIYLCCRRFEIEMQNMGKSLGMEIGPPLTSHGMNPPTRNTYELMEFFKTMKTRKVQLVVVVVPDRGDCYGKGLSAWKDILSFGNREF